MVIKKKFVLILLMCFSVYGCKNASVITDKPEKAEKKDPTPIFEIWKEVEGSVGVEGSTLLFRLYDIGTVEFDREIERQRKLSPPNVDFFIQRRCPAPLSKEAFYKFNLLLEDLTNSSIKQEYKPTGDLFDVSAKFTLLYKKDSIIKEIVINENDITDINTSDQNRFPAPLSKLINEVYSIRDILSKQQDQEKKMLY